MQRADHAGIGRRSYRRAATRVGELRSRPVTFFCVFCGQPLTQKKRVGQLTCRACGAVLSPERDQSGCVVHLAVSQCGASECCRLKR